MGDSSVTREVVCRGGLSAADSRGDDFGSDLLTYFVEVRSYSFFSTYLREGGAKELNYP